MTTLIDINNGTVSQNEDSKYVAHNMIMKSYIAMALQAALKLGIPDILAKAEGRKPLSAEEILRQLPIKSTPGPASISNLQRLLSPLVREGLFSESLSGDDNPVYGLTEVSKWFLRGNDMSLVPIADWVFSPLAIASRSKICLSEVILDDTTTVFQKANGVPVYEYLKHPEYGVLFQKSMETHSRMYFKGALANLLQSGVLGGVNTLVDVGGGHGLVVAQVVALNPHIQGINFDLPNVVATAPAINGVQHVGGSFFESLPSGDAMILKYVVHNYGDEESIQILKNCFKALPAKTGKVILAEFLKDKQERGAQASFVDNLDLIMLAGLKGAQERTMVEFQALLLAAGFPRSDLIYTPGGMTLIVGFKD